VITDTGAGHVVARAEDRPWLTFAALAATAALTLLDVSKVGVVLPYIQRSTQGSDSEIQFMLVGYTIAYALFLLPSGRLGDVLDRKKVFLLGTFVFVAASALNALAPSAEWLVIGRLVQGAGAGVLMPQVLGIIQRTFPAGKRTKPLAILAAILTATATFGPVIAGSVMQLGGTVDSWRYLFWLDVVVGVVVVPLAARFIREPTGEKKHGFDRLGIALLTPAVVFTIFPLSTISSTTPPALWMLATTVVGIGFGVAFVRHELRRSRGEGEPIVDPLLFAIPHFPSGLAISGLAYASGTTGSLIVTLSLEQVAGQSALQTALWMLPAAASSVLGSWITARLPQARSYRLIAVGTTIGFVALASISLSISTIPRATLPFALAGLFLLNSFGSSLVGAPNQARTLLDVPEYRSSIAGSLIQFAQRVGSAIGLALGLIVYYVYQYAPVAWSGRNTLGPTIAMGLTAVFAAISTSIAFSDRDRRIPPK
jgi:MFS family permease